MLNSITEAARVRREAKQAEQSDSWKKLIVKCAAGKDEAGREVDPEAVVIELETLGRSIDELDEAVAKFEHRQSLIAQVDAAEQAQAELPVLKERLASLNEKWKIQVEEHEGKVRPLQFEISRRHEISAAGDSAKYQLRNLVGESAQRLLDGVQVEISQVRSEIAQLQRDQDFHEASMLENERNAKNGELSQLGMENLKPSRERFKAKAGEIEGKQKELQRLVDKESELLKQAMFSPVAI